MRLLSTVLLQDSKSELHYPFMNNFRIEQIAASCSTTEPDIDSWLAHIIYNRGLTWLPLLCFRSNNHQVVSKEAAGGCCSETNFARPLRMEHRYSNRI